MNVRRQLARTLAGSLSRLLKLLGPRAYVSLVDALWEAQPFLTERPAEMDVAIHSPGYVTPAAEELPLVERIFAAYGRAREAYARPDDMFRPSSMWQEMIDTAYGDLRGGWSAGDLTRFHFFLANFGAWKETTGIEESRLVREHAADPRKRRHYEERVVAPIVGWWLHNESRDRGLEALAMPRHGNLSGVFVNGVFTTLQSVFSEVHGRLLCDVLKPGRPIIAELGGGYGKLFYFIAKGLREFCYLDFDLPETLCCASYFLMKTFPKKRFLLFGEDELSPEALATYDFILWPGPEISRLADDSVDLFINENSLGDMKPDTCRFFVGEIARTAKALWHRNHETIRVPFEGGTRSLVNAEYPIPRDRFPRVLRYCDVGSLIHRGRVNFNSDMFWYFCQREPSGSGPGTPSPPA